MHTIPLTDIDTYILGNNNNNWHLMSVQYASGTILSNLIDLILIPVVLRKY